MRRVIKIPLLVGGIMLGLVLLAAGVGWWMLNSTPQWYQPYAATPEQQAQAAQRAENKYVETSNWAAQLHARRSAALYAQKHGSTLPAAVPTEPMTISFTEEELNGVFHKWLGSHKGADQYSQHISDPTIFLHQGKLILAGRLTIKETMTDTLASVHFQPRLTDQGRLDLAFSGVLAGNLPMPDSVWVKQRDKVTALLLQKLPNLQRSAVIDPAGASNNSAMGAAAIKMLLQALNHQASDPIIFLPLLDQPRAVPVKLTNLQIADKTVTFSVQPLNEDDRNTLLQHLREPYEAHDVQANSQNQARAAN